MREYTPPPADSGDSGDSKPADADDPWAFVSARSPRKSDGGDSSSSDAAGSEAPAPEPAARGSRLGSDDDPTAMQSLRKRGLPMAAALAAVFFFGFVTEVVAAARFVTLLGSSALVIIYILGGAFLIIAALAQMTWIDRMQRDKALIRLTIGYAIVFAIALGLVAYEPTTVWGTGMVWLIADQLNFLLPFIIWAIVNDLFNAGEGRKVYPWVTSWQYGGQLLGLAVATVTPLLFVPLGIPLWTLLIICPIGILLTGILLPRALRGRVISRGHGRDESLAVSIKSTWEFVGGVKVFFAMFTSSVLVFVAAQTLEASYLTTADRVLGDEAKLQILYGATAVTIFVVCGILQKFVTTRLVERTDIPGALALLPAAAIVASLLIVVGIVAGDVLPIVVVGILVWWIPRWSFGDVARHAALAVVPDEKRARVSFFVGVAPFALGLIVAGFITWFVAVIGYPVVAPIIALLFAVAAIPPARRMMAGWSDALLDPRLRRRKRLSS